MSKGSLLVDAMIAMIIISMALVVAYVPSFFLLKKTAENQLKMDLMELLLNKSEEYVFKNASSIPLTPQTFYENYKGKTYKLTIEATTVRHEFNIEGLQGNEYSEYLVTNLEVRFVTIMVSTQDGKAFVRATVVPQQW